MGRDEDDNNWFGYSKVAAVRKSLPEILEHAGNGLTARSRELFAELLEELLTIEHRFDQCGQRITAMNQGNEVCQRLDEIRGIGPITASATYAAAGEGKEFVNGRHFSAWPGLVPGQHSTGGKTVLLGISKRGNVYLRTLYIHGARAVLRYSAGKKDRFSRWAQAVLVRRGHNQGLCSGRQQDGSNGLRGSANKRGQPPNQ